VNFKQAVENTPELEDAYRAGLQALSGADKQHVDAEDTRRLRGSANVDVALAEGHPNDPRWDYAIGHQPINRDGEVIYWIEIHPASGGEITVVLTKLAWLKGWLRQSAPDLHALPRAFVWVSSGKTTFTARSPRRGALRKRVCDTCLAVSRFPTNLLKGLPACIAWKKTRPGALNRRKPWRPSCRDRIR
jgi:hypothetical protein